MKTRLLRPYSSTCGYYNSVLYELLLASAHPRQKKKMQKRERKLEFFEFVQGRGQRGHAESRMRLYPRTSTNASAILGVSEGIGAVASCHSEYCTGTLARTKSLVRYGSLALSPVSSHRRELSRRSARYVSRRNILTCVKNLASDRWGYHACWQPSVQAGRVS